MQQIFRPLATRIIVSLAFSLFATSLFATRQRSVELDLLYVGHHWFMLRDAIAKTPASALYRGAVAAAFNQSERAEQYLQHTINAGPGLDDAIQARDLLIHMYMRAGQYSKAVQRMKEQIASKPGTSTSNSDKAMFAVLSKLPDQTVVSRGTSTIHYNMRGASLEILLNVNDKVANFLLDSDSNMSVISESEASRLGMSIIQGNISVAGVTGNTGGGGHMAVAKDIVVGSTHFKNVTFLVLRDDQEPFVDWPIGTRGILGLPVMLGLQTMRWRRDGKIEIGFPPGAKNISRADICFDNDDPITQLEFNGRKLEFVLDTGADESELWPAFARAFSDLLKRSGKNESKTLTGFTGSEDVLIFTLPEIRLALDDFTGILRPAPVLTKPTVNSSNWYYGRAAMDILNQAQTVTIDFSAMTFRLN